MKEPKGEAILDTNVASFMLKALPLGAEYRELTRGYDLRLSFATAAELRILAKRNRLSERRQLYLDLFLAECPVIPYCAGMEKVFAQIVDARNRIGRPLAFADALIATTAIFHDLPLVTHDADFLHTPGLRIIAASAEVREPDAAAPISRATTAVTRHAVPLQLLDFKGTHATPITSPHPYCPTQAN